MTTIYIFWIIESVTLNLVFQCIIPKQLDLWSILDLVAINKVHRVKFSNNASPPRIFIFRPTYPVKAKPGMLVHK